jgi:hypothetical protein
MRTTILKACLCVLAALLCTGQAKFPEFTGTTTVTVTGSYPAHPDPAPCFTDWNGDGVTDLLVAVYIGDGNSNTSRVQYYQNKGTNKAPNFQFVEYLKADGNLISPYWY